MSIFTEPKIDCHTHVIDPVNFPYGKDIAYKPSGSEIGTTAQLRQVMKTYGVSHSLLVQPNSGYGSDNTCMLDTIARGGGRYKGIAIVERPAAEPLPEIVEVVGLRGHPDLAVRIHQRAYEVRSGT